MPEDEELENQENQERGFESIEAQAQRDRDAAAAFAAQTEASLEEIIRADNRAAYDKTRHRNKIMLGNMAEEYRNNAMLDERLSGIVSLIDRYSKMDVTATTGGSYKDETALYERIHKEINDYTASMEEKLQSRASDTPEFVTNLRMASALRDYFNLQRDGQLQVPDFTAPENAHIRHIDTRGKTIGKFLLDPELDRKARPLFPHDPSLDDIRQHALGDCYLLSSLSTIASSDPQKIKDAMHDNGDGTVTVRFFAKKKTDFDHPEQEPETEPIYVTVDKVTPMEESADVCVWVQTMERAYAASGLHLGSALAGNAVPENIDELYETYSKADPATLPSHLECPWLIGEDGKLHPWQPDYRQIEGGHSSDFTELLLGPEQRGMKFTVSGLHRELDDLDETAEEKPSNAKDVAIAVFGGAVKSIDPEYAAYCTVGRMGGQTLCMHRLCYRYLTGNRPEVQLDPEKPSRDVMREDYKHFQSIYNDLNVFLVNMLDEDSGYIGSYGPDLAKLRGMLDKNDYSFITDAGRKPRYTDEKGSPRKPTAEESAEWDKHVEEQRKDPVIHEWCKKWLTMVEQGINVMQARHYPEAYSGRYTYTQEKLWDIMTKEMQDRAFINAGTTDDLPDNAAKGLIGGHAYSVVDLRKREVNGKTLRFVVLRNPWGSTTLEYTYGENGAITGTKEHKDTKEKDGGLFELELGDFARDFNSIYLNGNVSEAEKFISQINKKRMKDDAPMTKDCYRQYFGTLQKLQYIMKESGTVFSGASPEFKKLGETLRYSLKDAAKLNGSGIKGFGNRLTDLSEACRQYMLHCERDPRSGVVRETRLECARAIRSYCEMMQAGVTDPAKTLYDSRTALADRAFETGMKLARSDPKYAPKLTEAARDPKKTAALRERMLSNPGFRKYLESKTYSDIRIELEKQDKYFTEEIVRASGMKPAQKQAPDQPAAAKGAKLP